MDDNTPYRLAYDASVRAITDQAAVLESLRSRAGTMFAAAALVTSFFGGQALAEQAGLEVWSLTALAVAAFVATALLTIVILWPFELWFSLSARDILAIVDERDKPNPVTGLEAYRELALRLQVNYEHNARRVKPLDLVFSRGYHCLSRRGGGLDCCPLGGLMADASSNEKGGGNASPKPTPKWPDVTLPDTRGGKGPKK